MSATSNISDFHSAYVHDWLLNRSSRLNVAIAVSIVIHAIVLFGINFKLPSAKKEHASVPLEVVLVNSQSASKPRKADALAQANLDGGGNTDSNRRAKTPVSLMPKPENATEAAAVNQRTEQLEQEAKRLMTAISSDEEVKQTAQPSDRLEQDSKITDAGDLVQRSLEIARLEAQTAQDYEAYQKRPKRKFIGARTQEYRFARYVEDWRIKVERIGNLNYPEAAKREKLYGNLQLTVGIRSDGSLESIEINRPSGKTVLDEAAVRIVKLAGQNGFAPFPPDISRDIDILHITRTWAFTRSDELTSE
ncbi:energy transducer TonB [Nitrosovibrio tenuis]|uniref:Protein TonB n=1 Tax=Nitrosovibrio tenuis TaxID=1233 RepID=A0A1H7NA39_9PROT|nr:energy transducer TonB [Nitrosovibrio tenuis]SEL19828.1 protein TonB [Nitrosovibrio tenuis]